MPGSGRSYEPGAALVTGPAGHLAAARRIHAGLPVVDGHNDLPWELWARAKGDLDAHDPARHLDGYHTDLPRLIEGGVGLQFWSVYVPAHSRSPLRETHRQIDIVEAMTRRSPDLTALAATADQAQAIRASGRIAGMMGAEGGHQIENSLDAITELHQRNVRYITLTHADTTDWADSATDAPRHGGLSPFGEEVVGEMNRVGMLVDISHVAADTMRDAIRVSRAPVIASHSSAFSLAHHPRNLPDDVLQMVAETGGVVMVTFVPAFIVESTARMALDMFEKDRALRATFGADEEDAYQAARREAAKGLEFDRGTPADVADHIDHIREVAGVDHIGLGGDYDGVQRLPAGLEDVSCYPALTAELLARGWVEADIRKVLGENAMRVLRAAEEAAG
ncbi:MAG: dipeptidase [Actinobacteria bacterium]|nr:dipeptidase [Actinomycetota bacterium]